MDLKKNKTNVRSTAAAATTTASAAGLVASLKFPKLKKPASLLRNGHAKHTTTTTPTTTNNNSNNNRSISTALTQLNTISAYFREHPKLHPNKAITNSDWTTKTLLSKSLEFDDDDDNNNNSDDETNAGDDDFAAIQQEYLQKNEFEQKYLLSDTMTSKSDELYHKAVVDVGSSILILMKNVKVGKKPTKISSLELNRIDKNKDYLSNMLLMVAIFARNSKHRILVVDCREFTEERNFLINCKHVLADYIRHRTIIR